MSRTISQLTPGVGVWIDENSVHTEYIYLGIDGSGNCRLLRKYAAVAKRMNATNVAHYDGCEADLWMENEQTGFLSRFDTATINALDPTTICMSDYTLNEGGTVEYPEITRRCMALSYKELGFGGDETDVSFLAALQSYYDTTNANTARIGRSSDETAVAWWTRSGNSASQFRHMYGSGGGGAAYGDAANGSNWQRPAISVAPTTPVSDEGAETIFLLPDGRKTYWEINAICLMGSSVARPKKAKLMIAETGIQSATYRVSNNAKDANPIWVTCANGGVCDLTNTAKETTNYELGVEIDAHAGSTSGNVGEPVLVVEMEGT